MKTIHLIVSGRVQGVYFRAFTKKHAIKLGITGFVCNKENGDVEIVAQADQENLDKFINWCHKGPLIAKVENVVLNELSTPEIFSNFEICS
ncbi:MAG: acylphosphatase [Methylococcaceae bacterium]|nr:acylphosphatase [Methylococcaceae bacterium]